MPTTFTLHETSAVASGRKKNINTDIGEFWDAVSGLPDACWNDLVTAYNALEDIIDGDEDTMGTKSDNTTFKIGSSPSRPRPEIRV